MLDLTPKRGYFAKSFSWQFSDHRLLAQPAWRVSLNKISFRRNIDYMASFLLLHIRQRRGMPDSIPLMLTSIILSHRRS